MEQIAAFLKKHIVLFSILAASIVISLPIFVLVNNFNNYVVVEAGSTFQIQDLWDIEFIPAASMEKSVATDVVGKKEYTVYILDFIPVKVTVEVQDTTAPKVKTKDVSIPYGQSCRPEEFIDSCEDISVVSCSFFRLPDFTQSGTQEVLIRLTDTYNNSVVESAMLNITGIIYEYKMELGDVAPDPSVFLIDKSIVAEYKNTPDVNTFKAPGKYEVPMLFNGVETMVTISVEDNIPPIVAVKDREGWTHETITAEDFIVSVVDVSETKVSFKNTPDFSIQGIQSLIICVTDSYGNVTEKEVSLTLYKDTQAPVIHTSYIKVTLNGSVSYKRSVSVSDNCADNSEIKLSFDNSQVNLSRVGSYTLVCTATDTAGNTSTKNITVEVVETETKKHTQAEIDAYCDELLARITNSSMSDREKAHAIYRWTRTQIAYVNNSVKGDWLLGAYNGLVKKSGDCYTYAATAKALLERIGLEPVVIKKEITAYTSQSNHYWLLLDLGDGYYHYDPTPRADGTSFFMWTDAQLKKYSDSHSGSHNFTRDKYPTIR